jgi:hypothetical protein
MILTLAVILRLLFCLIRHQGHALDQIAAIELKSAWLALLGLALQWPLLRAPAGPTHDLEVQQLLFLLSHLFLLLFVWRNRHQAGILLVGLGVIGNLIVIVANNGFMPITPETLVQINPGSTLGQWPVGIHYGYSKDIILSRSETALWILSDILVLPPPFPKPAAFSLGDLFITAGIVVLLQGPGLLPRMSTIEPQSV